MSFLNKNPNDQDAALLAQSLHQGQKLADGRPYFDHLEAVASIAENLYMEKVPRANLDAKGLQNILAKVCLIRQVAFLHDSIEDQGKKISLKELLAQGYSPAVVTAIGLLTKDRKLSYAENILRVADDELARIVKMADNSHNTRLNRLPALIKQRNSLEKVLHRQSKYTLSFLFLDGCLPKEKYLEEMKRLEDDLTKAQPKPQPGPEPGLE
jgi:(p)ppGpp synthase/HD superfamily hydrolase